MTLGGAVVLASFSLTAESCDYTPCKPTNMVARDASTVDLSRPGASSRLSANLTANGAGLGGKQVTFTVTGSFGSEDVGTAITVGNGDAGFDLKRAPVEFATNAATADHWTATFAGDSNYCSSSSTARYHLLHV